MAKLLGVHFTIAVVTDPTSVAVLERAGVDVVVNPRMVTAEEIVRFAHDPRIRQMAMLEGDRFEILDITVREDSQLMGTPFRELPLTGSLIGAIVRRRDGDLPARGRHAPARRPGDPLHRSRRASPRSSAL